MNKGLPGHRPPSAGFEVPLEMLSACHLRIEDQCATLERLVAHLASHGADAEARAAATSVMRYFDTAAPLHHADEEHDLFPALIEAVAGSDAVCLLALTRGLSDQHGELEALWRRLRGALEQVIDNDGAALRAADVDAFARLYASHIAREESELLPMAARLLSAEQLDEIGRAMRERRGV